MATTSIRVAAKQRLVALLTDAYEGVQVGYAWPGQDMQDECVFLGNTAGAVTVRDFRAGRKARDDTFTVTVHFYAAKPGQTAEAADQRVEELYSVFEGLLADNPRLADSTGPLDGVQWAAQLNDQVTFIEPEPDPTGEGFIGEASAAVQIKSLLT